MKKSGRFLAIGVLLAAAVLLFGRVPAAYAQDVSGGTVTGDRVPAGETIENDVFLTGDQIVVDGDVEGDLFAWGRDITINGRVDGSVFMIGQALALNGEVTNSVYAVGGTIGIGEGGSIGRSLYGLTGSLNLRPDSSIGRDLNAISIGFSMSGQVQRELNLVVGAIELVQRLLQLYNQNPNLPDIDDLLPGGDASSALPQVLFVSYRGIAPHGAMLSLPTAVPAQQADEAVPSQGQLAWEWIFERLRQLVTFVIVGALIIWRRPRWLESWAGQLNDHTGLSLGYGFGFYVLGAFGLALFYGIVVAIGFGLHALTLRELAYTSWGLGLSGAGVLTFTFISLVAFVSKVVVAYLVGWLLWRRLSGREPGNHMGPLFIGLLIYVLVILIPFLGWVVKLLVTFFGLGAVARWYADRRSAPKTAVPVTVEEAVLETPVRD